jgi:hypothetical protein
MLYIAFVSFWVVILSPIAYTHLRDRGPEKSIKHFHEEHARFSERELSAEPVNRLAPGYARPIGRGTVFADDNYDGGYAPAQEYQQFSATASGQSYGSRQSSRKRRLTVTLTLASCSVLSWIGAAVMGGVALYAGIVMLVADLSYVGLYFVAINFGLMGYPKNNYVEEYSPVVDFAERRDARYAEEPIYYYEQDEEYGDYRRDALG